MGSTELHEDYIFVTENHDHAASDAIWLVKRYDPDSHHVEFYKVEPEEIESYTGYNFLGSFPKIASLQRTILATVLGNRSVSADFDVKSQAFISQRKHIWGNAQKLSVAKHAAGYRNAPTRISNAAHRTEPPYP